VISAFQGFKVNLLVQDFVKEAAGKNIRCLVIGSPVITAMKRTGSERGFRSNRAAKTFLNMAGVDLLRSPEGAKMLKVNSSPGFERIETATSKDLVSRLYSGVSNWVCVPTTRKRGAKT